MIYNLFANSEYFNLIFLISFVMSFTLNIVLTKLVIRFFKNNSYKSYVKKYYSRDIEHKMHTPSFGGVSLTISTILTVFVFIKLSDQMILNLCFVFISFFVLGLFDDVIKLKRSNSDGLSVKMKFVMQFIIALISCYWYFTTVVANNYLYLLPLSNLYYIDLGLVYKIFFVLFIIGYSNATNITDGIDELLARLTIIISVSLFVIIYFFKTRLQLSEDISTNNLMIFTISMLGGVIGFLWFNSKPADIFMGDSGSLPIGASIALISIYIKSEILILILGFIFVVETSSVIIQVLYFKISKGNRIFLMSPIHHHFQKLKISDSKIVSKFTVISLMISLSSLMLIFNIK